MSLRGAQLFLFLSVMAWEHVDGPLWRNAGPLDHPLGHRQEQGDEPQKHQFCKIASVILREAVEPYCSITVTVTA